jgi:uncharacterized protein YehS (DUF1456 family)
MLKKPYKFLINVDNNNYYAIKVEDTYYLATETVIKGKKKEFTQGLKLLPIRSFFLYLFLDTLNLKKVGDDEKDWGLEKEPIYETLDIKKLRERLRDEQKDFNKAMKEKNYLVPFDYAKYTHSETIKLFMTETETALLCMEVRGAYLRAYHLVKTLKSGNVVIHSCLAQGKPETEKMVLVETYVFNRETLQKFLEFIQKVEKGEKK